MQKVSYLTPKQIREVLDIAPTVRDQLVIELVSRTGLTRLELVSLDVSDIDFEKRFLRAKGKFGRERLLPLPSDTLTRLHVYIGSRKAGKLIRSQKSKGTSGISAKEINSIITKAGRAAGYQAASGKGLNSYVLRYSFVINSLKAGMSVATIRYIVGKNTLRKALDLIPEKGLSGIQADYEEHIGGVVPYG